MPELMRHQGFRFFFYSKEGAPLEPAHVHIRKDGCEVKLWLTPDVRLAWNRRVDPRTQKMLIEFTELHRAEFEERWNVYFAGTR